MTVKIIARISKKNYKALKRLAKRKGTDAVLNQALKQFFDKNHKMKMKVLLKKGYRAMAGLNLFLCGPVLREDREC